MADLKGTLIAFCNPLLDISANVDDGLLEKYELLPNNAILAEEKHLPLYEELAKDYQIAYTAGGSAQNTARAAQWLLPPGSTVYVGCIGKDDNGQRLRQVATEDGLQVEYLVDEGTPTGTCACLITGNGHNRSLVAHLGAANKYRVEHVRSSALQSVLEQANFFYISGFFLTVSPETIHHVAQIASERGKTVCLNLSAPFICQFFGEVLLEVLPHVDYLFGNESEALALAEKVGLSTRQIAEIAAHLSQLAVPAGKAPRRVVITQGAQPTVVASGGCQIGTFPVAPLAPEDIVDTNGAGDAFVGGFLSQLVQQKTLPSCIKAGHYAASVIIRRSGITFPARPSDIDSLF